MAKLGVELAGGGLGTTGYVHGYGALLSDQVVRARTRSRVLVFVHFVANSLSYGG